MKKAAITMILGIICHCCFAQHWQELGQGVQSQQTTTALFADTITDLLYVAGPFTKVDGDPVRGIASWDGTDWSPMADGLDSFPMGPFYPANTRTMVRFDNHLYAGGNFKWAGEVNSKYLARWNGVAWDTISGGQPNNAVYDLEVYNNELYVCGFFDSIGNAAIKGIGRWDGASWHQVGNYDFTPSGHVTEIEFYHGALYIGGLFTDSQNSSCRLAKWDSSSWQFMTSALTGGVADVWDMAVYNDELYVSGLFYAAAGCAGNSIVRWNDTTWRDVGGSCDFYSHNVPQVRQMQVHDGKLYCAGNFEIMGGIFAFGLASWNSVDWCGYQTSFMTNGQEGGIFNLAFYHDTLYVGGGFFLVDGDSIHGICKWTGGTFVDTCGHIATGIADPAPATAYTIAVYPNPGSGFVYFQFADGNTEREIIVRDQQGREVWRRETADTRVEFPASEYSDGLYFCSVLVDGLPVGCANFVVQH